MKNVTVLCAYCGLPVDATAIDASLEDFTHIGANDPACLECLRRLVREHQHGQYQGDTHG